jgi:hypothetical protein
MERVLTQRIAPERYRSITGMPVSKLGDRETGMAAPESARTDGARGTSVTAKNISFVAWVRTS